MARTVISSGSVSPRGLGRRNVGLSVVWLRGEHDIVTVSRSEAGLTFVTGRVSSAAADAQADELATNVAGRGGP